MAKQFYYAAGERIRAKVNEGESHPEMTFEYEPVTQGQKAEFENRLNATSDAVKLRRVGTDLIRNHVREWSLTKKDGSPVDFRNEAELNRTVPELLLKISTVILKGSAGDLVEDDAEPEEPRKNS